VAVSESEPNSPRARLQQLQAIPERQRTDAEWDELNELEIMLASGNRPGAPNPNIRANAPSPGGQPRQGGGPRHGQKQQRKFHRRPSNRGPR
jgi:hypothetical protein